jgi:DnaK suppressor protein
MNQDKQKFYQAILENKLHDLYSKVRGRLTEGMTEFEETEPDIYDLCVQLYTKDQFFSLCERERQILAMVEEALKKIRSKSFGYCEECQQPINEKRLEALPWVKLCITCQSEKEEGLAA